MIAAVAALAAAPAAGGAADVAQLFSIPTNARQLIVVSSPTYEPPHYLATLRAYQRASATAPWRSVSSALPAETGFGHLSDVRREGDGSTPTGVYGIGATIYGNDADPGGLHYRYHHLICGDWWDEDPSTPSYNRFVHERCGATPTFASSSEALWTEKVAYPYFAVVRFNTDPVVGGASAPGSGIFLHSWIGGPTAGCVALHQPQLLTTLRWLRPSAYPVIAIGTDAELRARAFDYARG